MDNETLDYVLSGSLDKLIPLPKRVVRLFLSSTFTDMSLERNSLMERVYPKLKSYCREQYGLDFQVVDMRWGVRDEATDDHQTVNLCSREIRNCQRMSLGPNFVALIGDKYGFRPLCNRIKSSEYRALRRCLIELDINTDFLDTWYREDLNAVPAEYLLQPISSILKNFTNKAEPELQSIDQRIWMAIQERIHELLLIGSSRLVAQGRLSEEEQMMRYSISVTEREVIEGCLDVNDAKQRCLVYVRSIRDLREHLQNCLDNLASFSANLVDSTASNQASNSQHPKTLAPSSSDTESPADTEAAGAEATIIGKRNRSDSQSRRASLKIGSDSINLTTSQSQNAAERKVERTRKLLGRYIDMIAENNIWKMDEDAQIALGLLKERKLATKLRLNGKNFNKFEINWHEQEGVSLKSEEHKKYLNELTEHFYKNLCSMIRKSAKSSEQQKLKSSGLLGEVLQHSHYARHVSKGFAGRTKELAHLRAYILNTSRRQLPMFIYGVGGAGKTSFLARSATLIDDWLLQQQEEQLERDDNETALRLAASNQDLISKLPCIISRFCGTTPSSSSMVGVLGSVCRQLQYNFYQFGSLSSSRPDANDHHQPLDQASLSHSDAQQLPFGPIPDDFVRLVFSFRQLLDNCRHKLHSRRLFVIILDSLEHLSPPADKCSVEVKYSWLTSIGHLPTNVRLVVSCSSDAASWNRDFIYLKRHFLKLYFDLERKRSQASQSQELDTESPDTKSWKKLCSTDVRRLEQKLIKLRSKLSGAHLEPKMSQTEERFHSLRLLTTSAVRFMNLRAQTNIDESRKESGSSSQQNYEWPKEKTSWILHMKPLGSDWARRVLQNWLQEAGRNLTQQQWSIVDKSFACCSRPIFIKLAFGEVINWKSYSMQSDTRGLTFGSSLLEKQRSANNKTVVEEDQNPKLTESLAKLMTQTTADNSSGMNNAAAAANQSDSSGESELFRWQIICMEQEWLSYLDSRSKEENAMIMSSQSHDDAGGKNQTMMTIRINGASDNLNGAASQIGGPSSSSRYTSSSSSSSTSICHLSNTIDDAICQLFARIEIQHGFLLTKHSLSYLTAAKNGICENELEDLLSLDDVVLDDVFQYHLPPVRRIPPLLWARIRSDLPDYLSERDADGTFVVDWHHGQFSDATQRRYMSGQTVADRQQMIYIHSMMADYFLGIWANKPKPFKCTKQQAQMAAEQLESAIQQSLRDSQSFGTGMGGRRASVMNPDRPSASGARQSFSSSMGVPRGGIPGSSISVHNRLRGGSNQNDQRFQWMQAKADRRVPSQPLFFYINKTTSSSSNKETTENETSIAAATATAASKEIDASITGAAAHLERRYNLRKLTEMPHHLICAGRFADLANEVIFNYKWLYCSLDALGLQNVLSDFDEALRAISYAAKDLASANYSENKQQEFIATDNDTNINGGITIITEKEEDDEEKENRSMDLKYFESLMVQINLLGSAIRLSCGSIAHGQTRMLAPQLLGRLLPILKPSASNSNQHQHLIQLLEQCDRDGCLDNCLLPLAHCLQSPEGLQSNSLEGHSFAVMAMALTNDQRHLLAVSNKFIMWDISTGELSRVIEPKIDGSIMRGLKLSANNKYALAYTSNNTILLLDILTQQVICYRKLAVLLTAAIDNTSSSSSSAGDDNKIKDLELIDKLEARRFIVWTRLRWFMFSVVDHDFLSSGSNRLRLSIKLEYSVPLSDFSCLSESSRRIYSLKCVEEIKDKTNDNQYLIVLGTRLTQEQHADTRNKTDCFRLSTLRVVCDQNSWNFELWSDKIDNISAFCFNESLGQIVYIDSSTNELHLKRRKQISWSREKILYSPSTIDQQKGNRVPPVLSLQMSCWSTEGATKLKRQDKEVVEQLRLFEQTIDDIEDTTEIRSCPTFDFNKSDEQQQQQAESKSGTSGMAIVVLYETSITVIQFGASANNTKFNTSCHLRLPKDVRNIQVEPNKCQMEALVVNISSATEEIGGTYLVLSFNRRLLFYRLCHDGSGTLLDSIEAHGSRIVQLLSIRGASKDDECLVASASMDKSVKIWNLSNLSKNSPSLDRLGSPIESLHVCSETGWAVCLSRDGCAIFDWRTLKLVKKLQLPDSSDRIIRVSLSSDGRYICLASLNSIYLYDLLSIPSSDEADKPQVSEVDAKKKKPSSISSSDLNQINHFKLLSIQPGGVVRKLKFFQQDSRVLATVVCSSSKEDEESDGIDDNDEKSTIADDKTLTTATTARSTNSRLNRRIMVFCFSIADGRLLFTVDYLTPVNSDRLTQNQNGQLVTINSNQTKGKATSSLSSRDHKGDVRLPVLTRDQANIVTIEFVNQQHQQQQQQGTIRRTSSNADKLTPLQLGVYSSRDGKLAYTINLSELEVSSQQPVATSSTNSTHLSHHRDSHEKLITSNSSKLFSLTRRCISITADQFTTIKAIPYLDRQSVIALIDLSKGQSFIVDLYSRQLIWSTSIWNGKLTSDGRYGLSSSGGSIFHSPSDKSSSSSLIHNQATRASKSSSSSSSQNSSSYSSSLLQLVEMRQCTPIRCLLTDETISNFTGSKSSSSSGSSSSLIANQSSCENEILCGFNGPNDSYVYYCDQRRRRLLLIRLADGQLVANYKLTVSLVSLKFADDGFVLIAGLEDGSLLSLAIVDSPKNDSALLRLSQFPSRKR